MMCHHRLMVETDETDSKAPREGTERLDLGGFLAELKNEENPVLFVPNSGNAGDALIGHATFQLFDRLGLDYVCLAGYERFDPSGRVVVCAGGGNLVPLYHGTERVLRWAVGRARRIILLPHTIDGNEDLLAGLGPEVDLICREAVSHLHVSSCVRAAHCYLADDLAFSLDVEGTLSNGPVPMTRWSLYARKLSFHVFRPALVKTVPSPWKIRRGKRLMDSRRAALAPGGKPAGLLDAFRTDIEKTEASLPAGNLDVAEIFSHGTKSPYVCHTGAFHMMRYLETFEEVRTNRLHVSIAAAMLGKRVRFQANSYYKNRAVYELSMRDRFANVEWVEADGRNPLRLG